MNTTPEEIRSLKSEWDALQPLSAEHDRRLWQKLRLEWNYHSNHIEGNTLTYGETELLLIHGATHGNHTLREYEEMRAHDVGIAHVRELAEDRTRLIGETDIRNLNKIILKEPFWKPARSPDGQPTRKQIIPGEYKTTPNNVITATGEPFEFAVPSDVPARMRELLWWLEESLAAEDQPLCPLLSRLHHEFVLIHPFDDGNGRVARMLVNYVLMRLGYPSVIVPTERKRDYLNALRLADAGDIAELENFLGACVIRSLGLGIKAANGESLEEPGDVEKEIEIFKRSQEQHKEKVRARSPEAIQWLYENGFRDLLTRLLDKMKVFDDLFVRTVITAEPRTSGNSSEVLTVFENQIPKGFQSHRKFSVLFHYQGYRGEARTPFNVQTRVMVNFADFEYTWGIGSTTMLRNLYSEPVMSDEITAFVEAVQKHVFEEIRKRTKQA